MPKKPLLENEMHYLKFLLGLSERGKWSVIEFCQEKDMISNRYECFGCD